MLTFVGFLRLANFVSAAAVIFGLVTEKLVTMESDDNNVPFAKDITKISGFVQVLFSIKYKRVKLRVSQFLIGINLRVSILYSFLMILIISTLIGEGVSIILQAIFKCSMSPS